jgi:hypothetical protein
MQGEGQQVDVSRRFRYSRGFLFESVWPPFPFIPPLENKIAENVIPQDLLQLNQPPPLHQPLSLPY